MEASTDIEHIKADNPDNKTAWVVEHFCGAWAGDETAEDIIRIIDEGKKSKQEPLSFDI